MSVLLNCLAQVLMRKGMLSVGRLDFSNFLANVWGMLLNGWLWGAMTCFAGSVLLWFMVLSRVPVSFAYPWQSLGIVVTAIAGWIFLGESIDSCKAAGILIIGIGILVLSRSTAG